MTALRSEHQGMRLLTWNVRGGRRPDLGVIASVIESSGADVVALQEVQERQARRLADRLSLRCSWERKHRPLRRRAEGQAILSAGMQFDVVCHVLRGGWPWSWRRRIALAATVDADGVDVRVACAHLASGDAEMARIEESIRLLDAVRREDRVAVAGDLNALATSAVVQRFAHAGFVDPWSVLGLGRRGTCRGDEQPPRQLDHILVRDGEPVAMEVLERVGSWDLWDVSDHLPVVALVRWVPGERGAAHIRGE